ncbi:IPT/TIG domain-containing protein [Solwaraspora sp. WMMD792]|uniref:IPT/TIG domain-containing protein n=1 Tax=Solwaraspora sp. WMMD792 TaxID=3016099 RepID=UPI002415DC07|nr:IPT/TIG domain-containing protein [Solwaraspora sp. WMMD792]MDG4773847.1 IPT/TIG domain-containing protein [Solwaraspora sp. WMMD792]
MLTVAALAGALASLSASGPVTAAESDEHAIGVRFDLAADVLGTTVIDADAVVGSATAPPTPGTDSGNALDIVLPTAVGVSASGTVEGVSVTRRPYHSTGSGTVSDLAVSVLGVPALAVTAASASVSCGADRRAAVETALDGLTVFGAAVSLPVDGSPITSSRSLPVTGLTDARLTASVTGTEIRELGPRVTAVTAATATFEITGDTAGGTVTVSAGTVTVAEAACARPAQPSDPATPGPTGVDTLTDSTYRSAATPWIDSVNPGEGTAAGGTTATVSGTGFVPGQTRVTVCGQTLGPAVVTVSGAFNVLTFPTPACEAGETTISVSTPAGTSNEIAFRYIGEGPPVTDEPGDGTSDDGLPVTGRTLGPLVVSGLLAILVGAALRFAAGGKLGQGRDGLATFTRRRHFRISRRPSRCSTANGHPCHGRRE